MNSTPKHNRWFWIGAIVSVVLLLLGIVYGIYFHPLLVARAAALRLQAKGAELGFKDFDESNILHVLVKTAGQKQLAANVDSIRFSAESKPSITDADLYSCRAYPDLKSLDLSGQAVTSEGLKKLAGLDLEYLLLKETRVGSGCGLEGPPLDGLAPLVRMKNPEGLELSGTCVVDADLASLSGLSHLSVLILDDNPISSSGVSHLSKLVEISTLRLNGTQVDDDIVPHLTSLKSILCLDLGRTKVTGKGFEAFRVTKWLQLLLRGSDLNDEGLRCIAQIPQLIWLDISETSVTKEGIAKLQRLPKLGALFMNGPQFNDEHLDAVADVSKLQMLYLFETNVTPAGIRSLERSKMLRKLHLDAKLVQKPEVIASLRKFEHLYSVDVRTEPGHQFDLKALQHQLGDRFRVSVIHPKKSGGTE